MLKYILLAKQRRKGRGGGVGALKGHLLHFEFTPCNYLF